MSANHPRSLNARLSAFDKAAASKQATRRSEAAKARIKPPTDTLQVVSLVLKCISAVMVVAVIATIMVFQAELWPTLSHNFSWIVDAVVVSAIAYVVDVVRSCSSSSVQLAPVA